MIDALGVKRTVQVKDVDGSICIWTADAVEVLRNGHLVLSYQGHIACVYSHEQWMHYSNQDYMRRGPDG